VCNKSQDRSSKDLKIGIYNFSNKNIQLQGVIRVKTGWLRVWIKLIGLESG
jgi:hypothetical protein